jgi:hypothetical protein
MAVKARTVFVFCGLFHASILVAAISETGGYGPLRSVCCALACCGPVLETFFACFDPSPPDEDTNACTISTLNPDPVFPNDSWPHSTRKGHKAILQRKYFAEVSTADDGFSTVVVARGADHKTAKQPGNVGHTLGGCDRPCRCLLNWQCCRLGHACAY